MKHGYYLYIDNLSGNSLTNKIKMQIKAFNEVLDVYGYAIKTVDNSLIQRFSNVFPLGSYSRDYSSALKSIHSPDFIYIRMIYLDRDYITFLTVIKNRFPKCKIIVEIPTYPYKKEWCSSIYGTFMYIKDVIFRKSSRKCIDRFVTYSYDEMINGIRTIQTMNGVDVDSFSPISYTREYDAQNINLIAVAFLMRHHGYERVIEGLKEYYHRGGKRVISVNIIGDGFEKKKYEQLIAKYGLSEHIKLIKPMYGEELNKMYDLADAGLSGFGFYKDGVGQVGTLKTREYLAKGLPVILGTDDKVFDKYGYEYGLLFPNDNSPIDFDAVIQFLDGLYKNRKKDYVINSIREFARKTIDNRITLAPIIKYIEDDEV